MNNERVGSLVEHRLKDLAVLFLSLKEMSPWTIRVVLVKQLVAFVWDAVSQSDAGDHGFILIATEPVAQLIPERTEGKPWYRVLTFCLGNATPQTTPFVGKRCLGVP